MEVITHPINPEEVRKKYKTYLLVGLILFIGTVATVAVATVPALDIGKHGFDGWDAALGLFIASFKASLVALVFMHLNHEKRWIYFIGGLCSLHAIGMGFFTLFAEFDSIRDPHFYQGTRIEDAGDVSVSKGPFPITEGAEAAKAKLDDIKAEGNR